MRFLSDDVVGLMFTEDHRLILNVMLLKFVALAQEPSLTSGGRRAYR